MEGIPEIQKLRNQETQGAAKDQAAEEGGKGKKKENKQEPAAQEPAAPADRYQPAGIRGEAGAASPMAAQGFGAAGGQGPLGAAGNETLINKNGTKLSGNDAAAIAEIFKETGKSGMKSDELVAALKAKGIDAYATKINGKMAIKFANGDTFVDTSGNGVLDSDDQEWKEAVKLLGEKYGLNFGNILSGGGGGGGKANDAVDAALKGNVDKIFGPDGLMPDGLTNPATDAGPAAAGGAGGAGIDRGTLLNSFSDLDSQLQAKGHQGPTAQELYGKGQLEPTLAQYGINMPQLIQNAGTTDFVNNLFKSALQVSFAKR